MLLHRSHGTPWHDRAMSGTQAALPLEWPAAVGEETRWIIRRSTRARRLALRVHLDGRVEVVVPRGVADPVVQGFMSRHREWVQRKLAARPRTAMGEPFPPSSIELPALELGLRLHLAGGRGPPRLRLLAPGVLSLRGDWAADAADGRRALARWLVAHVHGLFERRLRELADTTGFRYATLQLRRQRTRWGSCSARGVISLNVCAAFQSPAVLRYLMIHELAHTRHMNHSANFWRSVAEHCPDYRARDRELSLGWRCVPGWLFR